MMRQSSEKHTEETVFQNCYIPNKQSPIKYIHVENQNGLLRVDGSKGEFIEVLCPRKEKQVF